MRARFVFGLLLSAFAAIFIVGGASCYSTGDLGPEPFLCSKDMPQCPDGYDCDLTNKSTHCVSSGKCVCIKICTDSTQCAVNYHCDQASGYCLPGK